MRQVFQSRQTGKGEIVEVPVPSLKEGHLLIQTTKSLISLGTERMLVKFGQSNWIDRAKQHPDKVKQVIQKIKTDGLIPAINTVSNALAKPVPLGYCNVGIVRGVGRGIYGFKLGDRVISNGSHAELVCVPENLCAKIPDNVDDVTAVFTVLSSIALQGIRLINPTIGESVVVMGLGLIGLLACQILKANGCRVIGFDLDENKVALAKKFNVAAYVLKEGVDPVTLATSFSKGNGVDAVLITAATKSNAPIEQAPKMCRKRGRVVLLGVVGLELSRADFYKKEISFQVSCSYGPGRYETNYEKKGLDYPIGFVRWTEQRNFDAVLNLMSEGNIKTVELVSEVVPIDNVERAYDLVASSRDVLGIVLDYQGGVDVNKKSISLAVPSIIEAKPGIPVVGFIGAGGFTSVVLMPAFHKCQTRLKTISSSGGISGNHVGRKYGFETNTTDYRTVLGDPNINTVVITTQHDTHARFVVEALNAGKNVFVEKPLCLSAEELQQVTKAYNDNSQLLMVGFNRRFSPCTSFIKQKLSSRKDPLCMVFTVNSGFIPMEHWVHDLKTGGGRILGEGCHFIDLLRFITGSPIQTVQAITTLGHSLTDSDKMTISLTFEDGSLGTVHYFANGSKDYPKEKLEVFCEGKTIVLNNFRSVEAYGCGRGARLKLKKQDKGHNDEVKQFLSAITEGKASPIPFDEIINVTLATFAAVQSAKDGVSVNVQT